jgi:hypothetical protein
MQRARSRPSTSLLAGLALAAASLFAAGAASRFVLRAAAPVPSFPSAKRIAAAEAGQYAGHEAMVCGLVASARYASRTRGQPTFLDFGGVYPQEVFTAVIWGSERPKFKEAPEQVYYRKHACVTGKVQLYRGKPEIVVRDPAQLALDKVIQDPQ